MESDFLKSDDRVKVSIIAPAGETVYSTELTGVHDLAAAIDLAFNESGINQDAENYVFEVANLNSGVTHAYRINAHGHLTLIV